MESSFIFGNLDEETGNIDNELLDKDVLESLQQGSEYLSSYLGTSNFLSSSSINNDQTGTIKPEQSALDFSDMMELAAVDEQDELKSKHQSMILDNIPQSQQMQLQFQQQQQLFKHAQQVSLSSSAPKKDTSKKEDLAKYFPNLNQKSKSSILRLTDIFSSSNESKIVPPVNKTGKQADTRNLIYFIDRDARNSFYSDVNLNQAKKSSSSSLTTTLKPDNKNTPHDKLFSSSSSLNKQNTLTEMASQADAETKKFITQEELFNPLILNDWEDAVICDPSLLPKKKKKSSMLTKKPTLSYNYELDNVNSTWDTSFEDAPPPPPKIPTIVGQTIEKWSQLQQYQLYQAQLPKRAPKTQAFRPVAIPPSSQYPQQQQQQQQQQRPQPQPQQPLPHIPRPQGRPAAVNPFTPRPISGTITPPSAGSNFSLPYVNPLVQAGFLPAPKPVPVALPPPRPPLQSVSFRRNPGFQRSLVVKKENADRFNISDDSLYDSGKNKQSLLSKRVRQTYGPAKLQHSLPALKISPVYYKGQLTIKDLRSFHRPFITLPRNQEIRFSRVKTNKTHKKKAIKGKNISELLQTGRDITLRDNSKFVLFEYSEEHPTLLSNIGMSSLIFNYYRKKEDKDTFIPQSHYGSPYVLEQLDMSPFFGFGDVKKGQTVQAIYNNLYRAPIFQHSPPPTDFLMIRTTLDRQVRYYLREIPVIYTVGQTLPVLEVPRPQSRRATTIMKSRLKVAGYRMLKTDSYRRIKLEKLMNMFPGYGEAQVRQRLKDFAQFQRKGDNTGWWKLKPGEMIPSEDELRKLLSPETVCLYESMLVGEQWLRDAGYSASLREIKLEEEDMDLVDSRDNLEIEVQLSPWVITRNFIQASQGKGMVKVIGPGDPTGIGEGFSFIRGDIKEVFLKGAEQVESGAGDDSKPYQKYSIADQQQSYKDEIERIWNLQAKSLSSKQDIVLENEDTTSAAIEDEDMMEIEHIKPEYPLQTQNAGVISPQPFSPVSAVDAPTYSSVEDELTSIAGSVDHLSGKNKVLVINRLVKKPEGGVGWVSEIITDIRVMNAYLRQRTLIERTNTNTNPEATEEEVKRRRRAKTLDQLRKLKQQNRRGKLKLGNLTGENKRKRGGID